MIDGLQLFGTALSGFLNPWSLFHVLWATQLGIIVGMLPGLTATMAVALLASLTFGMNANDAILILICVYIGCIYGGSRTAILLNIPGVPANAATVMDGYALAKQGLAGKGISFATTGSFLGSIVGILFMASFTPALGNMALRFQSFEFFWLGMFGIVISGNLTSPKDPLKGWIAGAIGLFIAMIGMDDTYAYARFSFGNVHLAGGIPLIPAMVGVFGFAEVITVMRQKKGEVINTEIKTVLPPIRELAKYWRTILRSGIVGTFIGIIPGVGEDIAAWVSYDLAKRNARPEEKAKFGKGSIEGLLASETGNNASIPGALIPTLTLGIPGSTSAAVLLGAMMIHGIRPGPLLMIQNPIFIYQVVAMSLLGTIAMFVLGLTMVKTLVKVLLVPKTKLMPIVFALCVIGSFAMQSRLFDVAIMAFFGLLGFLMREMEYPMAPMLLGLILGGIVDRNLRRSLALADGDFTLFFTRPISMVLVAIIAFVIISRLPITERFIRELKAKRQAKKG